MIRPVLILLLLGSVVAGCGIKGDPLPVTEAEE